MDSYVSQMLWNFTAFALFLCLVVVFWVVMEIIEFCRPSLAERYYRIKRIRRRR